MFMSTKSLSANLTKDDVFHAAEKLFGDKDFTGFFGKNLESAIQKGISALHASTFYIAILLRNDPFVFGKMLFIFIPRLTCPLPHPNQVVYKFSTVDEKLDLLWTLPDPGYIEKCVTCIPNVKNSRFLNIYQNCLKFVNFELHKLSDLENQI